MINEKLSQLEARAAAAEKALSELKSGGGGAAPTTAAPNDVILLRLQQLEKVILADKTEAEAVASQRDELKKENELLRDQVAKQNYRITHLMRTITDLEKR